MEAGGQYTPCGIEIPHPYSFVEVGDSQGYVLKIPLNLSAHTSEPLPRFYGLFPKGPQSRSKTRYVIFDPAYRVTWAIPPHSTSCGGTAIRILRMHPWPASSPKINIYCNMRLICFCCTSGFSTHSRIRGRDGAVERKARIPLEQRFDP